MDTTGIPIKPGEEYGLEYYCEYKETINMITNCKEVKQISSMIKREDMDISRYKYKSDSDNALIFMHQELPGNNYGEKCINEKCIPVQIDYQYRYSNIRMVMKGYLQRKNSSMLQFVVNANYYHLQEDKPKVKISSVSLGLPATVSISFASEGSQKYYKNLVGPTNA